ncbi:MAG: flagellar hook-associated protein FlgL [Pseudomonadales bacterium]|jgi:flagellar hook-associated protein 3 FlgL|nr:flagellar hook-associated protein FlgL [Pseudomonadales bacterium]MDP4641037.1 flagellar hook-associated protein FlgL [Pseudomonadales bacterium]MDP4765323.1 flagellar hook-associated protein FlgL [Pseudomonadales bacterium]MDP4875922.1 flagellar hook-associated protein FlgL [Pseudomonadales bacterium]MDP4912274.1 flagellar hook-associated protein FlgL [Pseudomonadales bacterium]
MKISTNQMFNNSSNQIVTAQSKIAEMQSQLATGSKLVKASDEPQLAAVVLRLETAIAERESFERNLTLVDERLGLEESIIRGVDDILVRINELAIQGASDSLADSDRVFIGIEVQGLRDALVGLANSQDNEGRYLFAGSQSGSPAFQTSGSGQVSYAGDHESLNVNIAKNRSVELNRPGTDVFRSLTKVVSDSEEVELGFFDVLDDLVVALNEGNGAGVVGSLNSVEVIRQQVSVSIAKIGVERANIEAELDIHAEGRIMLEGILSKEKDVDYSVLVTELSAQMVALEAVQGSFAKIAQMSLFDYIR